MTSRGILGKRHWTRFPQNLRRFGVGATIATYPPEQGIGIHDDAHSENSVVMMYWSIRKKQVVCPMLYNLTSTEAITNFL